MRTKETETNYLIQGAKLLTRYKSETGLSWRDDPLKFGQWVQKNRKNWRKPTWYLYRQYLLAALRSEGAPEELFNTFYLPSESAPSGKGRGPMKSLPLKVLNQYVEVIEQSRGGYDLMLKLFLMANRYIGLRPIEFGRAKLTQRGVVIVKNAKTTNGRGSGENRRLQITSPEVVTLVRKAFKERDRLLAQKVKWSYIQKQLTHRLGDLRREFGLPWIRLYSTRHQFSADLKSSGASQRLIADLMGHAVEETAGSHYGKKKKGAGRVFVELDVVPTKSAQKGLDAKQGPDANKTS